MLQLPISSGSYFYFILCVLCCSYDLVRFRPKTHLVRPRKRLCISWKYLYSAAMSWGENGAASYQTYSVVSHLNRSHWLGSLLTVTQPTLPSNSQHETSHHIIYWYHEQHITHIIEMYTWHPQIHHFSKYIQYYVKILHCQMTRKPPSFLRWKHAATQFDLWLASLSRVALDVLHCLTSHLSFSWLLGIYIGNAPTQQKTLIVRIFSWAGYLQQNLILIHVILRDGTGPGCTPFRMHQCPQMPAQSQNTDSKGPQGNFTLCYDFVQKWYGFGEKFGWLQSKKQHSGVAKFVRLLLRKPCTCQISVCILSRTITVIMVV